MSSGRCSKRVVAEDEPLVAMAVEELEAAEERRERIELGENVPLLGKPTSQKQLQELT